MQLLLPEQSRAARLLDLYGETSNDYFKLWVDKEYWFTPSGMGFVAYGVSQNRVAVSLGDPIANPAEIETAIRGFIAFCREHRWTPLFYQVSPKYLDIYNKLGYKHFKGSEEAIVDLQSFTLQGKERKAQRNVINRMHREGITTVLYDTPVENEIITEAREVSDNWLSHNRRERTFTVGRFVDDYVRHTPLMAVRDAEGTMLSFANLIPSYAPDTATIDMMRFREDAPHGVMDFLFMKLFEHNKEQGFHYFSLGPAPIVSPEPNSDASLEEKAFYRLTNYLDTFFSMRGLRVYKEKFATSWEPRYLVYKYRHNLPRFVLAVNDLCELDENKKPLISRERVRQFRHVSQAVIQEMRKNRSPHRIAHQAEHVRWRQKMRISLPMAAFTNRTSSHLKDETRDHSE